MIVVSDTGPLRYLVELQAIDLLPQLYGPGALVTTPEVIRELCLPHFPSAVRQWASALPAWLRVESPHHLHFLDQLDQGEASALSLAREQSADLVLIDERDGTSVARELGLNVYGTLGILALAGARGLIDFEKTLEELATKTLFRKTKADLERARQRYRELKP